MAATTYMQRLGDAADVLMDGGRNASPHSSTDWPTNPPLPCLYLVLYSFIHRADKSLLLFMLQPAR